MTRSPSVSRPATMPAAARHMRSDTAAAITIACTAFSSPSEVSLVTTARS